jgi:Protein of unknown function (DUF3618)
VTDMHIETTRIEQDLEQTRARLDATIGALQQKLSPGQLLDQALAYLKESGGAEFGRNLKLDVQTHPMPVALIGIGLTWLMMSGSTRASSHDVRVGYEPQSWDDEPEVAERLVAKANAAAAAVQRTASETVQAFEERVAAAKAAALGVARGVGESASAFASRVDAAMQQAGARSHSAVSSVRHGAGLAAGGLRTTSGRAFDFLRDQPLLLGALGISVGALLAALLPPTRTEDELLGSWSDRMRDRARRAGDAALRGGARVAGEMMAATNVAEREGLTPEVAGAAMADAAKGARQVVEEAATAGRQAAERELGSLPSEAEELGGVSAQPGRPASGSSEDDARASG